MKMTEAEPKKSFDGGSIVTEFWKLLPKLSKAIHANTFITVLLLPLSLF